MLLTCLYSLVTDCCREIVDFSNGTWYWRLRQLVLLQLASAASDSQNVAWEYRCNSILFQTRRNSRTRLNTVGAVFIN